jgi:hypothetical protein
LENGIGENAMLRLVSLVGVTIFAVTAKELTPENWASETAGKTVFIKFQAPW